MLEYSYQHGGIEVMHESSVGLGALPLGGLAPSAVWFLNQNKSKSDYTTDIKQQQNLLNQLFCNKPCTLFLAAAKCECFKCVCVSFPCFTMLIALTLSHK